MAICVNVDSVEYQTLKNKSGVPEWILKATCSKFLTEHGRLPRLDEVPGSNSSEYISKSLKLSKHNSTKIDNILEFANANSVEEAVVNINNEYADTETQIVPIVEDAIVDVLQRPSTLYKEVEEVFTPDKNPSMPIVIKLSLNRLQELYGIKMNEVTDKMLAEQFDIIPEDAIVQGFILNGEIYINTDKASADTPIHEMMHMLIGGLRFNNTELYSELIQLSQLFQGYDLLVSRLLLNRTNNDIMEEVFVQELSKYLAGMDSALDQLDDKIKYEINYNIKRTLDSILMGDFSVKSISDDRLYNMSLRDIATEVNSSLLTGRSRDFLRDSEIHRKLNNRKADLIEKGQLELICE